MRVGLRATFLFLSISTANALTVRRNGMASSDRTDSLVVGLNAALQRRVAFEKRLNLGGVNRAVDSGTGVGGKGQGAWLATQQVMLAKKTDRCSTKLVQFYGSGDEGEALLESLRQALPGADVDESLWVKTASKTRICTTLVSMDSGEATEIVEPSGTVEAGEIAALLAALGAEREKRSGAAVPGVLVMGSMPPGVPKDTYGSIVEAAAGPETRVVIDSVAGLGPLLAAVAKVGGSAILKLNGRELLGLAGAAGPGGSDNEVPCDGAAVAAAATQFLQTMPCEGAVGAVCWTDGQFPAGALDVASGQRWSIALPPLPGAVQSPVGAGDAVAGATFVAWLEAAPSSTTGSPPAAVSAFAFGVAVGAASCLTGENSRFDFDTAVRLHEGSTITAESL